MKITRLIPPPLKNMLKSIFFGVRHWYKASHPKSPHNPWAFIRVCNEKPTLAQSLHSIKDAFKRGIIVYNECTDGSKEIIQEFCKKHPYFKAVEYPYQVAQCTHKRSEREYKKGLVDYYNFALSFIPQNEWLCKIDVDQIYDAKKLKDSFSLPKTPDDIVFYFRMNLHCFEGKIYLDKDNPIFEVYNHWLVCNRGLHFIESIQEESEDEIRSYELLQIPFVYNTLVVDLNTWHFPKMKETRRASAKIEDYVHISQYQKAIPQEYLSRIAPDMLDERRISAFLGSENMMHPPLISVIVPIYNVAPYLRECLDSIISQTYKNLQIILINDGSTDESEKIAKEYLRDGRVELVSIENRGLSGARNLGLDRSRGEYVYFIDSDDYIDLRFLEEMLRISQEFNVDLVCNDQIVYFKEKKQKCLKAEKSPIVVIPNSQNMGIGGSVWRCLFKKALIDKSGVRFIEGKIHEDEGFLYMIFPFCQAFVLYCGKPYFYRQRQNSIMCNHKDFRSYDLLDIFEEIYNFYKKNKFLKKFDPPYFFLYDCALGYKNEREYLQRARKLSKKLGFTFYYPSKITDRYKRLKNLAKRIMQWIRG